MVSKSNLAMASALEKLAGELEACAANMEQKNTPAPHEKTASASEYGHLDSRSSSSGEDALSRWLLG